MANIDFTNNTETVSKANKNISLNIDFLIGGFSKSKETENFKNSFNSFCYGYCILKFLKKEGECSIINSSNITQNIINKEYSNDYNNIENECLQPSRSRLEEQEAEQISRIFNQTSF